MQCCLLYHTEGQDRCPVGAACLCICCHDFRGSAEEAGRAPRGALERSWCRRNNTLLPDTNPATHVPNNPPNSPAPTPTSDTPAAEPHQGNPGVRLGENLHW